jgi:hypothetical protein
VDDVVKQDTDCMKSTGDSLRERLDPCGSHALLQGPEENRGCNALVEAQGKSV